MLRKLMWAIIFCFEKLTTKYCSDIVEFIVLEMIIPKVESCSTSLYWKVYQGTEVYKDMHFTHGFLLNKNTLDHTNRKASKLKHYRTQW